MVFFRILLLTLLIFLSASCGEVDNNDYSEEVPCSSLSGRWAIHRVTCADRVRTVPDHILDFKHGGGITSSRGGADCTQSYVGNVTHTIPHISIVGDNNFSCKVNNSPVPSCVGGDLSCSAAETAENLTNSFSVCVLKELDTITLLRTSSSEDIASGVSYCTNPGEKEEWTLTIALPEGSVASLSISESPLYDFGSVAIGGKLVREFVVTNISSVPALAVAPSGISGSLRFAGGAYPGIDGAIRGSCGTIIPKGSCTMLLEFSPDEAKVYEQTLSLAYDNSVKITSAKRILRGTGI